MRTHLSTLLLLVGIAGCQSAHHPTNQPVTSSPPRRVMGIDVSHYQRSIDWPKVKADGKSFAWAKATEGINYTDRYFKTNVTGAKSAGVLIGAYHFARYDRYSAVAEADFFWSVVKDSIQPDGRCMQPMLDVEHAPAKGQDREFLTKWVNDWCSRVQSLGAAEGITVVPLIYCNLNFARGHFTPAVQENWPLWYAYWSHHGGDVQTFEPPTPGVWKAWQFWQYGGSVVSGVRGKCDSDVLNGGEDVLRDYIVGSTGRWADGAAVQVGSSSINVSASLDADAASMTVPAYTMGTVLQGPVYRNSYQRWQIRFENGVTAWCKENLTEIHAPSVASR